MLDRAVNTQSRHHRDDVTTSEIAGDAIMRADASIPDSAIRAALERIVSSSEFRTSPHLAAFLRYSVETTLLGEGANIKAYTVATSVLGRPPTFDPQNDPIVRVEATRLRRAMERYYLHEGQDDPLRIDIPRGRYIASFSWRSAQQVDADTTDDAMTPQENVLSARHPSAWYAAVRQPMMWRDVWHNLSLSERRSISIFAWALVSAVITWTVVPVLKPTQMISEQALILQPTEAATNAMLTTGSINTPDLMRQRIIFAILQLTHFDSYSELETGEHGIADELSHRLNHLIAGRARDFDGIPIIDPDGPESAVPNSQQLYSLLGTILQDHDHPENFDIAIRLVHKATYEIIWTREYHLKSRSPLTDPQLDAIRDEIVTSLSGPNGVIRIDDAKRHRIAATESSPCQICLADSDVALRTRNPDLIEKSLDCLVILVQRKSEEPLIHKQLSAILTLRAAMRPGDVRPLDRAVDELKIVLALDPEDHQAESVLAGLIEKQKSEPKPNGITVQ